MDDGRRRGTTSAAPRPLDVDAVEEAVRDTAALVLAADALEGRYRGTSDAADGAAERLAALRWAVRTGRDEIARLVGDRPERTGPRRDRQDRPRGGPAV